MTITTLPIVKAQKWVDDGLAKEREVDWARNYHRKLRLIIQEDKVRGKFFSTHDGETCMSLSMGLDLEIEQALRALIKRIDELETHRGNTMSNFKQYRRKGFSEMRPYIKGEDLTNISVSPEDDPESDIEE